MLRGQGSGFRVQDSGFRVLDLPLHSEMVDAILNPES
jgi:hypothetical protein